MEYPTEEQIQAVLSELTSDAEAHAGMTDDDRKEHHCELCDWSKHLNSIMEKDETYRVAVDMVAINHMSSNPMAEMALLATGGGSIVIAMARAIFWMGYKVGRNMEANKKLMETFGSIE